MANETKGIKTVLHPVSDLAKAKSVYSALLGMEPQVDSEYYVGYEAGGQHIGLVPGGGPQGMTTPVTYWEVADIEAKYGAIKTQGATSRSQRRAPRKVSVRQWPCGAKPRRRPPRGPQPRSGAILVLIQVSSMNTSRRGSR